MIFLVENDEPGVVKAEERVQTFNDRKRTTLSFTRRTDSYVEVNPLSIFRANPSTTDFMDVRNI